MRYGSVCSGIEAASLAWEPLGWSPAWFAEIDPFACAILKHRWPHVPNLGDMTTIHERREFQDEPIDILVGGTPCQSFSVAGIRSGLADPRGNLALVFLGLVARKRPTWIVWENVPGVRSADDGRALGAFLGGLGQLGYGWAYRSLDAQYFNLAQRRERVFVVGHSGGAWQRPFQVLFEPASLRGDPPPRRETGQGVTADLAPSLTSSGRGTGRTGESRGQEPVNAMAINARGGTGRHDGESETFVAVSHALRANGFDASEDGTGRGTPIIAIQAVNANDKKQNGLGVSIGPMYSLTSRDQHAVAFAQSQRGEIVSHDTASPLSGGGGKPGQGYPAVVFQANASSHNTMRVAPVAPTLDKGKADGMSVQTTWGVRRLMPVETERLQGMPDEHTQVPYGKHAHPSKDGPRYKAIGNSMAVPCMAWIGRRIARAEAQ